MTYKDFKRYNTVSDLKDDLVKKGLVDSRKDADAYIREHLPKESVYQKKIMDHIKKKYPDAEYWKNAAGAYSSIGIPDITVIYRGHYYGLEVKRPFVGKPSQLQLLMIQKINQAGGHAALVTYSEDFDDMVKEVEGIAWKQENI